MGEEGYNMGSFKSYIIGIGDRGRDGDGKGGLSELSALSKWWLWEAAGVP